MWKKLSSQPTKDTKSSKHHLENFLINEKIRMVLISHTRVNYCINEMCMSNTYKIFNYGSKMSIFANCVLTSAFFHVHRFERNQRKRTTQKISADEMKRILGHFGTITMMPCTRLNATILIIHFQVI